MREFDRSAMSTRDRILDVAAESFLADGYAASRMMEIARRAGVSRATLYKYFPDKRSLLSALHERVSQDAKTGPVTRLREPGPAAQRIGDWLRDSLQSRWRHNAVRVLTMEETQGVLAQEGAATGMILANASRALETAIRAGIRTGELRADLKPKQVAHALQSLLLGLQRNNVALHPVLDIRDDRHIETVVSILVRGLLR